MPRAGAHVVTNTRRLRATIQRTEQQPYDYAAGVRAPRMSPMLQLAVVVSTISARSGTTLGSGTVHLVTASGTTLTEGTVAYSAYSFAGAGTIGGGKYCLVTAWGPGLLVVSVEC